MPKNALPILYDADGVVAIAKPAGLLVIPGRDEAECARSVLSQQLDCPLLVVHRLDRDTSGVLLFARDSDTQRFLSRQFQSHTVRKEYLALVVGKPTTDLGTIDAPIGVHPTDKLRMAVLKHGGRDAKTSWKVETHFRDFTLLRVFPKTGKTHQIRVHLAHVGLPLAIDPLYRKPFRPILLSELKRGYRKIETERPLIERLTLHAHRLRFVAPSGREVQLEAELPKDFRAAVNQLGKLGR